MKTSFTQKGLREDIAVLVGDVRSLTITSLARLSDIDPASLSRFCAGKRGLSGANIEKLWPYLYGDKRPKPETDHDQAA